MRKKLGVGGDGSRSIHWPPKNRVGFSHGRPSPCGRVGGAAVCRVRSPLRRRRPATTLRRGLAWLRHTAPQTTPPSLLADNPTLMRLRELEVLEKIASNSKMSVVLGEKGLADRVVNLL